MLIQPEETASPAPPERFEVMAENWDAVCLYLACQTQWIRSLHIPPMGGEVITEYQRLDYTAVDVVLKRSRQFRESEDPALFEKLQVMERTALPLLNAH